MNVAGALKGLIHFWVLLLVCFNVAAANHPSFQALVDATEPNGSVVVHRYFDVGSNFGQRCTPLDA